MTKRRIPLPSGTEDLCRVSVAPPRPASSRREVLHELEVHEIELKLQNEELQKTQLALREALERYRFLYEFSPVAYLSLGSDSSILEINLTGVRLLGVDRKRLLRSRLLGFVAAEDVDKCYRLFHMDLTTSAHQVLELTLKRDDGTTVHVQMDCEYMGPDARPIVLRATLTDISDHVRAEAEIQRLAFYDPLTGLPNRRLLFDRWQLAMEHSARSRDYGAILLLDLDDFKTLNDTFGHHVGDLMLCAIANQLSKCVRTEDTVARLGGDEFVVLLQGLGKNPAQAALEARAVALKLCTALQANHQLLGSEHRSSVCIGIALFHGRDDSITEVLKHADLALYRAKAAGGGSLRIFEPEMQAYVDARSRLEDDLRRGIERQEFRVHFQPQFSVQGKLLGAEALLRWQHPVRGLLLPVFFISMAEEKGLIGALDRIALSIACTQLKTWSTQEDSAHLTLSVNISASQFASPEFVARTLKDIALSAIDPRKLVLEITESMVIESLGEAREKMNALKAIGLRFSLDDFGIGGSSLSYLRELPLDEIKIDRSFVHSILCNRKDAAIAATVIDLGARLGMTVVAEGVETEEQKVLLAGLGCTAFQGYLYGEPVAIGDLILDAHAMQAAVDSTLLGAHI